jgi:hypothetical protein
MSCLERTAAGGLLGNALRAITRTLQDTARVSFLGGCVMVVPCFNDWNYKVCCFIIRLSFHSLDWGTLHFGAQTMWRYAPDQKQFWRRSNLTSMLTQPSLAGSICSSDRKHVGAFRYSTCELNRILEARAYRTWHFWHSLNMHYYTFFVCLHLFTSKYTCT